MAVDRRLVLTGALAALAASGLPGAASAAEGLELGASAPYSFEALRRRAAELAAAPYQAPVRLDAALLDRIDYDAHGRIRYRPELALWAAGPSRFPVTFFHLGRYFTTPVRMHVAEGGQAREIVYNRRYFDMPADSPAQGLADNPGFAGFRFQEARDGRLDWRRNDWAAFLGASYFRAIGDLYQYGLSARGVAVDTAVAGRPEDFPAFTHVYLETPAPDARTVVVCALLDGESLAGAFRFRLTREVAVTMEVEASLHLRRDVSRLGIAPLTSMYWYSETAKPTAVDWRPEVHDSDGLQIWTGAGERIWRPLNNPPRAAASAFADEDPRAFGLMQRDRVFDHYLDGVRYERRPSLWIEPVGRWGRGALELIELPTDDEIHDNIVAAWVPAEPARAGQALDVRYRMRWAADEPSPPLIARCTATRLGNGGQAGTVRPQGVRKIMVEFKGEPLARLPSGVIPETVVTASRGAVTNIRAEAVPDDIPGHWRTSFDLAATGSEPVDLRLYLRRGEDVLSETWLYQYHPLA